VSCTLSPKSQNTDQNYFFVISLWGLSFSFHADASIGMFIFYYVCSDSALV